MFMKFEWDEKKKDDDTIHIISARKANKHESKIFTKEIKDGLG